MLAFWIALGILIVAPLAGVVFAVVRARALKNSLKSMKRAVEVELQRIARSGERTNEKLEATQKALERLEASLKRLRTAQARLRLIREALAEASALTARIRAFVPSK